METQDLRTREKDPCLLWGWQPCEGFTITPVCTDRNEITPRVCEITSYSDSSTYHPPYRGQPPEVTRKNKGFPMGEQ